MEKETTPSPEAVEEPALEGAGIKDPQLVASTGSTYHGPIFASQSCESATLGEKLGNGIDYSTVLTPNRKKTESNVFRSAEWTSDGTTLVTVNDDNCIRTFVAPPDLLTNHSLHSLTPYNITSLPSTPYAVSLYPFFSLSSPETTLCLSSIPFHPIHLRNLLYPHIHASYPLIHEETETYLTPSSLLWTREGTHFLAGTDSQIHLFDISRDNAGPIETFVTSAKRKKNKSKAFSDRQGSSRGIVSALAQDSQTSMLAAGTYTRHLHLYSSPYQDGELVSSINLGDRSQEWSGNGITHLAFSSSGRNLFVAERKSRVIHIYDVRDTSRAYGHLRGRAADTNQKIGFTIGLFGGKDDAVVSGGTDGVVRVWEPFSSDLGDKKEPEFFDPVIEWKASEDPITSAALHPTGCVVATSSGERKLKMLQGRELEDSDDESVGAHERTKDIREGPWENGLKIWAF